MQDDEYTECLEYIFNDLLSDFESVMIGEDKVHGALKSFEDKSSLVNVGCVVEELRVFGEKCKYLLWVIVKVSLVTLNLISFTYFPCWRKGKGYFPIHKHHNNRNLLLKRNSDHTSNFLYKTEHRIIWDHTRSSESVLVYVACVQRLCGSQ